MSFFILFFRKEVDQLVEAVVFYIRFEAPGTLSTFEANKKLTISALAFFHIILKIKVPVLHFFFL
jgi:hypothetical protein